MSTKQKRPAKKTAGCDCLAKFNDVLKEQKGCAFDTAIQINFETGEAGVAGPFLSVHWYDKPKRGKLPTVVCAYCPFCGKKRIA